MWNIFKIWKRLATAEGLNAVHLASIADLNLRIENLESERRELMDWLLSINGAPTLYAGTAASRHGKTSASAQTREPSPTAGARNGREFQRLAEAALGEEFFNEHPEMRQ